MMAILRHWTCLPLLLLVFPGIITAQNSLPHLDGSHPHTRQHFEQSIDTFLRGIRNCPSLTLYEGLPHPRWEQELLEDALNQKQTIQIHGFHFYRQPIEAKLADKRNLRRLCSQARSFQPYTGPKFCGGYHPDWCLTWKNGEAVYQVLVCFGCQEARIYSPTSGLSTDLTARAAGNLKRWLVDYGMQRPKSAVK